MKKLFTIMLIFLSIGMASAYEPSSFRAGSAAVYGVQTTYPGTGNLDGNGAHIEINVVGSNNQFTVDQSALRGASATSDSSATASRVPTLDTGTATRRSQVSGCEKSDCDQPTKVTPVASITPVSSDSCEMIPYNVNDVNDKTTFWYVVGCFIDISAFTIDDSITKVVIPSKDSLMAFDGQSVNGMTFSADVGQWLFSQWQGPLITTSDNTLYAFAVANNGGRCIECFEVEFASGFLRFVSLGWIGLGTAPASQTVPLKANRVRHESGYMIH